MIKFILFGTDKKPLAAVTSLDAALAAHRLCYPDAVTFYSKDVILNNALLKSLTNMVQVGPKENEN